MKFLFKVVTDWGSLNGREHIMEMQFGQLYYRNMPRKLLIIVLLLSCLSAAADTGLPAYVLQLPASVSTVLIAETDTATLHQFGVARDGLVAAETTRMSIGQNGVAKQRTGDRRTPLGIYFVVEELDTSGLNEKYGPVAFPLDYPNAWDSINNRTGYGIWIHGVAPDGGIRPKRDTDGCIALPNDQLLSLKPYLSPSQTPVIVTRQIRKASEQEIETTRELLLDALDAWVSSYRRGDWNRFLSSYAQEFVYRGMSLAEWSAYRLHSVGSRKIEDYTVADVLLLADPEDEGLFLSRFRQEVTEDGQTVATTKRLYWRKSAAGRFQIVAEDNG